MDSAFVERILARTKADTIPNLMHGFIITLTNDRVWKANDGKFLFLTEDEANRAFYRDMRNQLTRQYIIDGTPQDAQDDGRYAWNTFKRLSGFSIKKI